MNGQILLAGFGGQGILFAGKFLAYKGLIAGKQVSWLPSYGPEMRGGTANCSVIISDEPVGSPIVSEPDILVTMNLPSLDKYEKTVKPGGIICVESSLIKRKAERADVTVHYIPATKLASDNGMPTLANMIMLGKLLAVTDSADEQSINKTLEKVIPARKQDLFGLNKKALEIGYNY